LGPMPGWGSPRKTRLTFEEQRTLMTLWAISRSPLFIGANLTKLEDDTLALLTNKDLVAMDQYGHDQKLLRKDKDLVVWTSKSERGTQYLAVFNLTDDAYRVRISLKDYGLTTSNSHVREIGYRPNDGGLDLGRTDQIAATIGVHGVRLWELSR